MVVVTGLLGIFTPGTNGQNGIWTFGCSFTPFLILPVQKEWREDYNGTFKKNVMRCVRKSQDMLQSQSTCVYKQRNTITGLLRKYIIHFYHVINYFILTLCNTMCVYYMYASCRECRVHVTIFILVWENEFTPHILKVSKM